MHVAIALFTKDDFGAAKEEKGNEKYRARQNVVFEAGYFMGCLGRENTIIIVVENVVFRGDLSGLVYSTYDIWEFINSRRFIRIGNTKKK